MNGISMSNGKQGKLQGRLEAHGERVERECRKVVEFSGITAMLKLYCSKIRHDLSLNSTSKRTFLKGAEKEILIQAWYL